MGNASSAVEGGEEEGIDGDDGQDLMGQSPPRSPGRAAQASLLFTPQGKLFRADTERHKETNKIASRHSFTVPRLDAAAQYQG